MVTERKSRLKDELIHEHGIIGYLKSKINDFEEKKLNANHLNFNGDDKMKKTNFYCPYCGKQDVYEDTSVDDYYNGTSSYCASCKKKFPTPFDDSLSDEDRKRIDVARKNPMPTEASFSRIKAPMHASPSTGWRF